MKNFLLALEVEVGGNMKILRGVSEEFIAKRFLSLFFFKISKNTRVQFEMKSMSRHTHTCNVRNRLQFISHYGMYT